MTNKVHDTHLWEHSGSEVKCLTLDGRFVGLSHTGGTVLCP